LYKAPGLWETHRRLPFPVKDVGVAGALVRAPWPRGAWPWTFHEAAKVSLLMNERRSHIRRRTFKGGKLIFNKGLSVLDCVIRDMSDHGARVELGTTIGVPDTFELIIAPDRVKRSCKIAWRSKRQIGISFR
jgi:hypothetical protein